MEILVTGGNGQVGSEIRSLASKYPQWDFVFTDVEDLDITKNNDVINFFKKKDIDYCINCAAYTAVDKAEEAIELAHAINVTGVKNLAEACSNNNASFIQLSTDYIYHNQQNKPFKEGDTTNPQSVYASTKLAGDQMAQSINPSTLVIRTSWVYSVFGHNFVKTMLRLGAERDNLGIVFDQIGTPTNARDLASAILQIINKIETKEVDKDSLNGVFHYSNEGVTSWYDFALAIFDIAGIQCKVDPIETIEYPTPAKRPPFSVLNKKKIKKTFGIEIPYWRDSLKECVMELQAVAKTTTDA